jgi:glycosyltransferase involved in cell wall biosynthesis
MRVGVYSDLVYRTDGETLSTDQAFIVFVTNLAPRVGELVVFGRLDPVPGRSAYALPREGVRFVPLPHYPRVTAVRGMLRSLRRARGVFEVELEHLDAVWLFGPVPASLMFARSARRRGTPMVLGVRQDLPEYVRNGLPSKLWLWTVPVAHGFERAFRRLARTTPAVVVGEDLRRKYAGGDAPVLATGFSLVRREDLVTPEAALAKPWDGPLRILSVGRLDYEKNPLLLPEILARLDRRWRLTVVGDGPLEEALRARAAELGVAERIDLRGYVAHGPDLWAAYRDSDAFLHVSLTEGLPQVLFEAQAAGLPVVATDVGGVRDALAGGSTGLIVPPEDAPAAAAALERLADDAGLRERLVRAGLESVVEQTMDAQLDRIAELFRAAAQQ